MLELRGSYTVGELQVPVEFFGGGLSMCWTCNPTRSSPLEKHDEDYVRHIFIYVIELT